MATTARVRLTPQPDTTRARPPFPNAVGDGSSLARQATTMTVTQGMNVQGDNSTPVQAYLSPNPGNTVQMAPGDPLRPIPGMGDQYNRPRAFPFPVGGNITPTPRQTETTSFETLRNLAAFYEGIQLCQQVHFRILSRLDLAFVPRPEILGSDDPSDPKWVDTGRRIAEWFEMPDKRQDLRAWMTAAYRDILEIDALGIFHERNRGGGLYALDLLAGDYISCLADGGGRRPPSPAPAYLQVLYGIPAQLLTEDEMDYLRETSRTESLYGLSRVERILMRVNLALRKGHFDLARFTDGVTPAGVLETQNPALFTLTADQVQLWQDMFNGALAGNDAMRVRTKAVPPGWTFKPLTAEEIVIELDRWLLNITAAAHGLSMDELGMTETSNRSVGDSQEKMVYRNAVRPTADFFARYFSTVLRRYDGLPMDPKNTSVSRAARPTTSKMGNWDARYMATWRGMEEQEDFQQKVSAGSQLFAAGLRTKLQVVRWLGLPVEKGEKDVAAFIQTRSGMDSIVVLDDIEANRSLQQQARQLQLEQTKAAVTQQQLIDKQMQGQSSGGEESPEDEPPPEDEGGPSGGSGGGSESEGGDEGEQPAADEESPDSSDEEDDAEKQVNDLIAQAQTKKSTGKAQRMQGADTSEDWRLYRTIALKAVRRGEDVPDFVSRALPANLHAYAAMSLANATTPDEVRAVFADVREAETHADDCRCMVCGCGQPENDHGMPYSVMLPGDTENDGCMVAFFLPASMSQQLAIPGGMPVQDMHITLAYLGPDATQVDKPRLLACMQQWAQTCSPLYVDIDYLTRFDGDEETYPVVVRSYTQALMDLRVDLVAALDAAGLVVDMTYPEYKPHVTLCYLPQGTPMPVLPISGVHGQLTQVWVAYGDERYAFPLGGTPDERNTAADEVRLLRSEVLAVLQAEYADGAPTVTRDARQGEPLRDARGHFAGWVGGAPHEIANGMNARREATHLQARLSEHETAKQQALKRGDAKGLSRLKADLTWKSGGAVHQGEEALKAHLTQLQAKAHSTARDLSVRQLFDLKRSYRDARAVAHDTTASVASRDAAQRDMDAIAAQVGSYNQANGGSKFDINA
jgi:2'-5' RNA ligase